MNFLKTFCFGGWSNTPFFYIYYERIFFDPFRMTGQGVLKMRIRQNNKLERDG